MRKFINLFIRGIVLSAVLAFIVSFSAPPSKYIDLKYIPGIKDSIDDDSLLFPFDDYTNTPSLQKKYSPLFLKNPSTIQSTVKYDPKTGKFVFYDKIGNFNYRTPYYMPFDEFISYSNKKNMHEYWMERSALESAKGETSLIDRLVNKNLIVPIQGFDKVFGSNTINIKPQGNAELIFGLKISETDNPGLAKDLQKSVNFDFDMNIKMGVNGQIGDKLKLGINFDTDATFEFENNVKLAYEGKEDEIIQKIEAGNVTMPLSGSLITGSHNLFGLKTELKFGKLLVTTVFSQQKGESKTIEVAGGATTTPFEITVDDYDANRHYFISQHFRDRYDQALANLPITRSNINIRKVEVWVTNRSGNFENSRNILAFMDLGEENEDHIYSSEFHATGMQIPSNESNTMYKEMTTTYSAIRDISMASTVLSTITGFNSGIDYEKVQNARLLSSSEYSFNINLGYISLNSRLSSDEVLAVAFEYENTSDGNIYTVGEFSNEDPPAPEALFLKLLKPTTLSTELPTWDLMMKNVYSFNAYQVNSQDFRLDIMYRNDKTGSSINYLPAGEIDGKILLNVLNLDNLNKNNEPGADGFFDFIDKITINASNGKIFFPVVEPFGSYLKDKITGGNESDPELNRIAEQYIFQELYDQTQSQAQQMAEKNKFYLRGEYRSSGGSEINLNAMNVPEGSVTVTAGGRTLEENIDYTVDYNLGRVNILNQSLFESGTPIQISLESNSMFNIGTKSMIGSRFDYMLTDNFNIGATIMHLHQKPLTNKVNIGSEPISNTIWGTDLNFNQEVPFLTKFVDKFIPLIKTKAPSHIDFTGEFAHLIPGHPKILSDEGLAHIDDFEGSKVTIDLKSPSSWKIASTPQGQSDLFPEADSIDALSYGFNRAKIAWYNVSRDFLSSTNTPDYITIDDLSDHMVREIPEQEIFPDREPQHGVPQFMYVMNLAYYPNEKGPYNFDVAGLPGISAGIDQYGNLNNPGSRWAGMTRDIITNDFEEANIEFIEFWVLDPFVKDTSNNGGDLYFNLGNISEDILRDSRQSFENGLPSSSTVTNVDTTAWGRVPILPRITEAFATEPDDARQYQDVGLDGLSTADEKSFFKEYLNSIDSEHSQGSDAYTNALSDPSNDNFLMFNDPYYDENQKGILDRYKSYNNQEGNSTPSTNTSGNEGSAPELIPDMEDINRDYTLTETEAYFQYKIHMVPNEMEIGKNYITDIREADVTLRNENKETVKWYQFKIPLEDYEKAVGPIQDFKSIRFIRLFMKGWDEEVILRFAKMDLVRGDWRKYRLSMLEGTEGAGVGEITDAQLDINTVNIEENSSREPVNYILPPGITREISPNNQYLRQLNEQAISLKVTNLCDGDARAAYKNASLDVRQFERLQMFIHAEAIEGQILNDDDLCAFIRLGSDYKENYYEYEIPLKLTEPGFYNNETDNELVWIPENMLDIEFEVFQGVKQRRNEKIDEGGNIKLTSEYSEYINESGRRVSITGSPNLSNVRTIMIGVRNRKKESNILPDDALAKSIEIWMNELRLSGFKEQGGWATRGRLQANLADFSTIAIAGEYSTPGFGSIEKNVNERQQSTDMSYDFSTSAELGKFFPKKYGVRIPVYIGYSEIISKPEYDPLNPDIKMAAVIKNMDQKERDHHLKISQDYLKRKTFNVTNIRINGNSEKKSKKENKKKNIDENDDGKTKGLRTKGGGTRSSKNKTPWHISNWSTSYGYNETFISNINTEHNILKIHTGAIAYNYNISPRNVKPFTKVKLFRRKPFRIIKDINFYYAPSLLAFRTDLRKSYNEIQLRNINDPTFVLIPTFDKQFTWNRTYDLRYNLTRGLKLTYSANNQSWVDEPEGRIDKDDQDYKTYRNAVIDSLKNFGRTTDFHQKITGTWSIPINKLPLLDWTTANARYDADYYWTQNPIAVNPDAEDGDTIIDLGNTIRNNQAFQISTQLNIERLYTKVKYLKSIDNQFKGKKKKKKKKYRDVSFTKENVKLKKDKARSITHNLRVEDVKLKVTGADGKEIEGKTEIVSENKVKFISENDVEDAKIEVTGKREIKENALKIITDYTLYTLMSVRNVSLTYSENNGTVLPGYMRDTKYFGCDESWKAPGWQFLLGIQDPDLVPYAATHGWLSDDTLMTTPVIYTGDQTYDFKATLKPFTGLRIDVTANRRESFNESQLWLDEDEEPRSKYRTGDFSMSILTINTAFGKMGTGDYSTDVYTQFLNNRYKVAMALANERSIDDHNYIQDLLNNPDSVDDPANDYPYGYKSTSKDVLTESFLAAYTGQDVGKFGRNPFPTIPMPNWRIKYDGLTYFDLIRKVFKKVIINHGYRSTYRVSSFNIDPEFDEYRIGTSAFSNAKDSIFFAPEFQMDGIAIDEKFIPLIGIDVRWNNDMSTKLEYKQARALILSFANNQILETSSKEYVVGFGYKIPDLNIPLTIQGNQKLFKSDLNIRVDFTYREMMTVIRRINEGINDISAGNNNISIKVNADYNLDKVTFRIFYDRIMNKPRVSTAYKTTNTHIGFSLRFNLSSI